MANKKITKINLDKDCLLEALLLREKSVRQLGSDHKFGWSAKSVERGIKTGGISPELMDALGSYLNVESDYLSGKYHRTLDSIECESIRLNLRSQLNAKNFPYIRTQQSMKNEGKFLSEKYVEYVLILHNISLNQYEEMNFDSQKAFLLDLEDSVIRVLMRHFMYNAYGKSHSPDIFAHEIDIQNYDPNEP